MSVKLLAWNIEIKCIAKQKKKNLKTAGHCTGLNLRIHCFGCSPADLFWFCRIHWERHDDRTEGTVPLGRGKGWKPCSVWRLLRNPSLHLNSFLVLQLLQSGILICAKGKQKEKQPNPTPPTTPTPPYYNKNGAATLYTNTWGHPEQSPDWHFILCCRNPHLFLLANKTPFQHTS